jgi:subtilisin family serine protease
MNTLRMLHRVFARKRPRPARVVLCVEQLEIRDVPATTSLHSGLLTPPSIVTIDGSPVTPNDPRFTTQWDLQNTSVPEAWSVTTGSRKTTVAVLDTGVDYNHPDLYQNIWINQQEIPKSRLKNLVDVDHDGLITFADLNNPINQGVGKITDFNHDGRIDAADILAPMVLDANGNDTGLGGWAHHSTQDGDTAHPDDLIGWNFVDNTNNPFDDNGHGTNVSGTIGAMGNNGVGVAGINWSIQIMALKFLDSTGTGTLADATAALNYAVAHGASITNNSWSGGGYDTDFLNALQNARAHGQIFVAAAANDSQNLDASPTYPANYNVDNLVAVAATDQNNQLASFSNYGPHSVLLGAPGVNILNTTPNGQYQFYTGTSMAAPHVTGVLALLESLHPTWTYQQVIAQVAHTADPYTWLKGKVVGAGLLDAAAAVGAANAQTVFVQHLYADLLGRAPSTTDLNAWLRALYSGTTREQIAKSIWESREHRGREIDSYYVKLLHHHVDSVHLQEWLQVLQSGGSESDVLRGILASADYAALHPKNSDYVISVYNNLLGRNPTSAELAAELQKLLTTDSRAAVAQDVLGSGEYLRNVIQADYTAFLNRQTDATTLQNYVSALINRSQSLESIAVGILASDEYYRKS